MPKLIDADALIQATEAALTTAQKAGDTREIIKHNMLLCALREAETVDPVREAGGCYCRECEHFNPDADDKCTALIGLVEPDEDDFCSCGEPREGNDDNESRS